MSRRLQLGPDLQLPLAIASMAAGIFGIRGAGKTNTAGVIAEELLRAGQPIAVIDPTDAWWGLRSLFPVVTFGGSHGQLPLTENDGNAIAEFVVHDQLPVILSMRHLRKAEQRRLVTAFCSELFHLKGKPANRSPLTVFIDEASLFAPQRVMGEYTHVVGAIEDLVARGRNAGFGVVLINQRPATLNADVRSLCDVIVTHRMTGTLDRKAFRAWIEENATVDEVDQVLESLAKLKDGEAWVWAPALDVFKRVQIRMRESFDSSRTPKPGEKVRAPKKLADVDLEQLKGRLAASIERAKADDPATLRAQISTLERQMAEYRQTAKAVPEPKVERVEVPVLKPAELKRVEHLVERIVAVEARMNRFAGVLIDLDREAIAILTTIRDRQRSGPVHPPTPAPSATRKPAAASSTRRAATPAAGDGRDDRIQRAAERRVLTALAQHPQGRTRRQVAILAGYALNGGGFKNALSRMRSLGFVDGDDTLRITESGQDALGAYDPLPAGAALGTYWLQQLDRRAEREVLGELLKAYPSALAVDEVAQRAGYEASGGGFKNAVSKLRTLELIEGRSELRASKELVG